MLSGLLVAVSRCGMDWLKFWPRPSLPTRTHPPTPRRHLQWAIKLFPFGHIPARYLCILAAGDPRFQIAEAATEGLQPSKFASGAGAAPASARRAGGPEFPAFAAVLEYLQQQAPALGRRPAEGVALALPAKVRWRCRGGRLRHAEPRTCPGSDHLCIASGAAMPALLLLTCISCDRAPAYPPLPPSRRPFWLPSSFWRPAADGDSCKQARPPGAA